MLETIELLNLFELSKQLIWTNFPNISERNKSRVMIGNEKCSTNHIRILTFL